jgi:hypothetical protein
MIFCSGALSHLDTFDYKPELVKRHDTPMPGKGNFISFQGENGNLIRPQWEFKPRGQSGKMISELLPNMGELADELCFIHSMTAKVQHARPGREPDEHGFILDGFPAIGCWASYALGSECDNLLHSSRFRPTRRAAGRTHHWNSAFLPARIPGHGVQCGETDPTSRQTIGDWRQETDATRATFCDS